MHENPKTLGSILIALQKECKDARIPANPRSKRCSSSKIVRVQCQNLTYAFFWFLALWFGLSSLHCTHFLIDFFLQLNKWSVVKFSSTALFVIKPDICNFCMNFEAFSIIWQENYHITC